MRIDLLLVQKKMVTSRTQAQDLILGGFVYLQKKDKQIPILKSNTQIDENDFDNIYVSKNEIQKYVSRGGLKLEAALNHLKFSVKNFNVFDVGQSTGGFTDCLLQLGAHQVVGIDVGHQQLHPAIQQNPSVISFEGVHVKDLASHSEFLKVVPTGGFDLIVIDVSFVSLTKVMPFVKSYLKAQGHFLFLVKPQFELTAKDLDRNGVVKDSKKFSLVQSSIQEEARLNFGLVIDYFKSEVIGKDGNQEFFIYGCKTI